MEPTLESLFVRFARSGHLGALATVYDRVAPELLRIAMHVSPSAALAEDLVQATFVTAIERARDFDATRLLRPWLSGILTMHAKTAARRGHRRPDLERLESQRSVGPLEHAERIEFTQHVDRAIAELPQVYQPVLVLKLKHGMNAAEIAYALRRPAGTVRTQCVRALELLRERLPKSYATLGVFGSLAARGNAAVRNEVLAAGRAFAATLAPATAVSLGGLLMKKMLLVAAALALAGMGWVMWPTGAADDSDTTEPSAVLSAGPAEQTTQPNPVQPPDATRVDTTASPAATTPDTTRASLRIRVVWRRAKLPANDIEIRLTPQGGSDPGLATRDLVTDADGLATCEVTPGRFEVAPDRSTGRTVELAPGQHKELVFELSEAHMIRGRVVDAHGQPIAKARVWLALDGAPNRTFWPTESDAQGKFRIRGVPSNGFLSAVAPGFAPCKTVPIPRGTGPADIELRLEPNGGALTGRVVDPDGLPIEGALVQIGGGAKPIRMATGTWLRVDPSFRVRTRAGGRFAFAALPAGKASLSVRARGFVLAERTIPIEARSSRQLQVQLNRGATIEGTVRDASGAAIAGALVTSGKRKTIVIVAPWTHARTETDAHGHYRLAGVQTGKTPVAVSCARGKAQATLALEAGATVHWSPRLAPPLRLAGRVVDATGRALAKWNVTALPLFRGKTRHAHTNANGEFEFDDVKQGRWKLNAAERTTGTALHTKTIDSVRADVLLRVPDARPPVGTIAGVVLLPDGRPATRFSVRCRNLTIHVLRKTQEVQDAAGHFTLEHVAFGQHEIQVRAAGLPRATIARVAVTEAAPDRDLGVYQFQLPGSVSLTIRDDGDRPVVVDYLTIHSTDGRVTTMALGKGGVVTQRHLPPGAYTVDIWPNGYAPKHIEFAIEPGKKTTRKITLERGIRCELPVEGPKDHRDDVWMTAIWRNEADQELTRDSLLYPGGKLRSLKRSFLPGTYRVELRTKKIGSAKVTFHVERGGTGTVRLPSAVLRRAK